MKNVCEIVQDLLPAYLDHTCSRSSKECVEEHITHCDDCKKIMEEALCDLAEGKGLTTLPDAEALLRKTSKKRNRKAVMQSLGVLAIAAYWLVYLWAKSLADQANYRYFSWSFWEVFSAGTLIVPILTVLWLVVLAVQSVRKRTWKKTAAMIGILLVLCGAQFGYLHDRAQIVSVDSWTDVDSIPDEYHIVINGSEDSKIILETTPTVTRLVRTDGTIYGFSYEQKRDEPDQGVLLGVWNAED